MTNVDVVKDLDVTTLNASIDRLLEVTENPRHRFLLQAFNRHRYLEVGGRYEDLFAADMMVDHPVYHFHDAGVDVILEGQEAVKGLYRMWAETDQCIFYVTDEQVAVADRFIATITTAHQQLLGTVLASNGIDVDDENAMYLYYTTVEMIWPYDERGRLVGEDVWEVDPTKAELFKLDSADVLTVQQAAERLSPLIEPLPSFDEAVLGRSG